MSKRNTEDNAEKYGNECFYGTHTIVWLVKHFLFIIVGDIR